MRNSGWPFPDDLMQAGPQRDRLEPIRPEELFGLVRNVSRLFQESIDNNRAVADEVRNTLKSLRDAAQSFANAAGSLERILDNFEERQANKEE